MKIITLPKIFKPFYCPDIIRLGKDYDGGYLLNSNDVSKSTRLLSFGIGTDTSFEADFYNRNACTVSAYDGTIDSCNQPFLHFYKQNIDATIADYIDLTVANTFIKCDIEGSEYDILDTLIRHSRYLSGAVIEFHNVYDYSKFNELTNFIAKFGLSLIHVHANNNSYIEHDSGILPDCLELSFTSSDNIVYSDVKLPHPLDMPNTNIRDELKIVW